jgi:hypothetical protein
MYFRGNGLRLKAADSFAKSYSDLTTNSMQTGLPTCIFNLQIVPKNDRQTDHISLCSYFDNCLHLKPLEFSCTVTKELPPFLPSVSTNRVTTMNTM